MESKTYITDGHSRRQQKFTRIALEAAAQRRGVTLKSYVVRISNECYACIHHSRRLRDGSCGHRCTSDVSNNGRGVEVFDSDADLHNWAGTE